MNLAFNGILEAGTINSIIIPTSSRVVVFIPIALVGPAPTNQQFPLDPDEGLEIACNLTLEGQVILTSGGPVVDEFSKSFQFTADDAIDTTELLILPETLFNAVVNDIDDLNTFNNLIINLNILLTTRVLMKVYTF